MGYDLLKYHEATTPKKVSVFVGGQVNASGPTWPVSRPGTGGGVYLLVPGWYTQFKLFIYKNAQKQWEYAMPPPEMVFEPEFAGFLQPHVAFPYIDVTSEVPVFGVWVARATDWNGYQKLMTAVTSLSANSTLYVKYNKGAGGVNAPGDYEVSTQAAEPNEVKLLGSVTWPTEVEIRTSIPVMAFSAALRTDRKLRDVWKQVEQRREIEEGGKTSS